MWSQRVGQLLTLIHDARTHGHKNQISIFMKIRPVGAELLHAERRTDMTKLIVTFCNLTNASKNGLTL